MKKSKIVLEKDFLIAEYEVNRKSSREIAEGLNIGIKMVTKYLKLYGIVKRNKKFYNDCLSKDFLIKEYEINRKSCHQIAVEIGLNEETVRRHLEKHSIIRRENFNDLTGQRFGRLLVLERAPFDSPHYHWLCLCDCGNIKVSAGRLLGKGTQSCGCYFRDVHFKGYEEITGVAWDRIKRGADDRKLEFNITLKDAWEKFLLQDRKCAMSGVEIVFKNRKKNNYIQTASLDRIDSTLGYTVENIQWVHKVVNSIKMSMMEDEFIYWCRTVSEHTKHRKIGSVDTETYYVRKNQITVARRNAG